MKKAAGLFAALSLGSVSLSLVGAGCAGTDIHTATAPQARLSQYHSYAWSPEAKEEMNRGITSILDQTVASETDRQLAHLGLVKTQDPANADLLLHYNAKAWDEAPAGATQQDAFTRRVGTLTIALVDPKKDATVWQGSATDDIAPSGATQKQVIDGITQIFQRYPVA